ncbi:MAG: hypothetical protein ACO3F3_04875 [Gemmataceae bacterium]
MATSLVVPERWAIEDVPHPANGTKPTIKAIFKQLLRVNISNPFVAYPSSMTGFIQCFML